VSPGDSRRASVLSSFVWLAPAAVASVGAWFYFDRAQVNPATSQIENKTQRSAVPAAREPAAQKPPEPAAPGTAAPLAAPLPDAAAHAVQVVLKAKEASWVQVVADGKTAFTGMLNPNDSREIEADSLVKVTAGNAGGLEISLNGKSLDPLGPSGQVRTVRLTADGPQPVVKTTPPAPL
ncbi:MAG: DUF4115 domain-containing protein, partial [Acidobacteriota bacterium]